MKSLLETFQNKALSLFLPRRSATEFAFAGTSNLSCRSLFIASYFWKRLPFEMYTRWIFLTSLCALEILLLSSFAAGTNNSTTAARAISTEQLASSTMIAASSTTLFASVSSTAIEYIRPSVTVIEYAEPSSTVDLYLAPLETKVLDAAYPNDFAVLYSVSSTYYTLDNSNIDTLCWYQISV